MVGVALGKPSGALIVITTPTTGDKIHHSGSILFTPRRMFATAAEDEQRVMPACGYGKRHFLHLPRWSRDLPLATTATTF